MVQPLQSPMLQHQSFVGKLDGNAKQQRMGTHMHTRARMEVEMGMEKKRDNHYYLL